MIDFITHLWSFLQNSVGVDSIGGLFSLLLGFLTVLISFLPNSPFTSLLESAPDSITTGLGWLNYFVPFGSISDLLLLWAGAIITAKLFFYFRDMVLVKVRG